jgi:hypothetical protein
MTDNTKIIAFTAICISEAFAEAQAQHESGDACRLGEAIYYYRRKHGICELRDRMVNLAVHIEAACDAFDEETPGELFSDQVACQIGCWDYEFIPQLMDSLAADFPSVVRDVEDSFDPSYEVVKAAMRKLAYGGDV